MQNHHIQNKIENSINSLQHLQKAEPRPFFYTRLTARMNNIKQSIWERFSVFITQPATAIAGLLIIIMMNFFAAYTNANYTAAADQPETSTATTVDEYTQVATNLYDLENIKP